MGNHIYDKARYMLLTAQLDWLTIPLVLTAWGDTPFFVKTDQSLANIASHGSLDLGHSLEITAQSVLIDGTAQTNSVVIPAVPIGAEVTWFTMSWLNATYTASIPILFIDEAEGLPFDPNGLDMVVQPDWLQNRGWWRP